MTEHFLVAIEDANKIHLRYSVNKFVKGNPTNKKEKKKILDGVNDKMLPGLQTHSLLL